MKLRRLDRILKNTGSWRAAGEAANKGENGFFRVDDEETRRCIRGNDHPGWCLFGGLSLHTPQSAVTIRAATDVPLCFYFWF